MELGNGALELDLVPVVFASENGRGVLCKSPGDEGPLLITK